MAAQIAASATGARLRRMEEVGISELGKVFEFAVAAIDFGAGQAAKAIHAEFFAAETSHDRSINHRAAQLLMIDLAMVRIDPALGQVSHEAPGERIACSGR